MNLILELTKANAECLADQKIRQEKKLKELAKPPKHGEVEERAGKFYVGKEEFVTYLEAALYLKQVSIYSCYPNHAKCV